MTAKGSRAGLPVKTIEVGEEPTTCIYCGSRTNMIGIALNGKRREVCIHCEQQYDVEDEIETIADDSEDAEEGVTIPAPFQETPILDKILAEFEGKPATPEVGQEELNHLFGIKPSPYPDFGSY